MTLVVALTVSIAGLLLGPFLLWLSRGRGIRTSWFEGLSLGLVPTVLLVRLLPHIANEVGPLVYLIAFAGFVVAWISGKRSKSSHAHHPVGPALLGTLGLHALTDGAALAVAVSDRTHDTAFPLFAAAVVLHRFPEGLMLARMLVPRGGFGALAKMLMVMVAATLAGAVAARHLESTLPDRILHVVIAFGFGALLYTSVGGHAHPHGSVSEHLSPATIRRDRLWETIGFCMGIGLVLALPSPDDVLRRAQAHEIPLVHSVVPLFVETAPSLMLGLLLSGVLHTYAQRRVMSWLRGGGVMRQAMRGLVFGVPLPVCSCGIAPLAQRLLRGGAPLSAVVSFALATPELGVGTLVLSARLLGLPFAGVRLIAGALLALIVATVVATLTSRNEPARTSRVSLNVTNNELLTTSHEPHVDARWKLALKDGFGETLDHVGAWYLLGIVVAAVTEAAVDPSVLTRLHQPWDVVVAALVALPVYLCAEGATPIAAVMIHKGLSPGAALAFLLVGAGMNLAVVMVLRRRSGGLVAAVFALAVVLGSIALAWLGGLVVPRASVPEVHPLVAHAHAWWEWACCVVLAVMLLVSLSRLGPHAWLATLSLDQHEHEEPQAKHAHDGHPHQHHHS